MAEIPQGFSESDEEDELYEEVEDTRKQHSQFYIMVLPLFVLNIAGSKFNITSFLFCKYYPHSCFPAFVCEMNPSVIDNKLYVLIQVCVSNQLKTNYREMKHNH